MSGIKTIFSIIAVVLTFVGYVPYIRSIVKNQTKPHLYSWIIWLLDDSVIFALQITHGAGVGAFFVLAAAILSVSVIVLTIRSKGKQDITGEDVLFSAIAVGALILWLFAKQPLVSTLLIV